MKRVLAAAAAVVVAGIASSAHGQALADRVPGDAMLYFGWAGSESLTGAYGTSHLKAVLDETRVRDLFGTYLDQAESKLAAADPSAREPLRLMRTLATPMWKYPTAFFVGKPDLSDPSRPKFYGAYVCRAASSATLLANEVSRLLADAPQNGPALKAAAVGDLFVFSIGYDSPTAALADASRGLARSPAFAEAIKQTVANPAIVTFVNPQAMFGVAEQASAGNPNAGPKVKAFLDASGLRAAKAYIFASGFEGKDWVSQSFLSLPAADRAAGLWKAMPDGPVDPTLLKLVPSDATYFATQRFDLAAFLKATRDALAKTDPQAVRPFNQAVGATQLAIGVNPLDGLLEPMGSDWVFYSSPRTGAGLLGMVAANKLDDPAKFEGNLKVAVASLMTWINTGISRAADAPVPISIHTSVAKVGDVSVNYLALPLFAPAWTIRNGKLFVGLYPQSVGAAARVADKPGQSIADNAKYQAVLKRLGTGATSLDSYIDLPTSVAYGSMYPQLVALTRYAGFGDLFGLTLPEPLVPPIDVLMDHVAPTGSASWSDASGWHSKSVVPFPGATLFSEHGAIVAGGVGGGAMVTSIILPSLNRARETANRVKSASNLKQMGMGMLLYANENNGNYPPDLGTLITTQDLVPEVFVNPRAESDMPTPPPAATPAGKAAWVNENSDYVYVGAGKKSDAPAEDVIAYENPEGLDDGINLLFGDGHVEFMFMDEALQLVEDAKAPAAGGL